MAYNKLRCSLPLQLSVVCRGGDMAKSPYPELNSMPHRSIRLVVAGRHSRTSWAGAVDLGSVLGLRVVGEALDPIDAVSQVERLDPDVAVVGASTVALDGIQATYLIKEQAPG